MRVGHIGLTDEPLPESLHVPSMFSAARPSRRASRADPFMRAA
jgi:hypothetical protein